MGLVLEFIYYILIFKSCLTYYVSLCDDDNNNVIPPLISSFTIWLSITIISNVLRFHLIKNLGYKKY